MNSEPILEVRHLNVWYRPPACCAGDGSRCSTT